MSSQPLKLVFLRAVGAFLGMAVGLFWSNAARADESRSTAARPSELPLSLVVFGDLPSDTLRDRLATRLGRPIVLSAEKAPDGGARLTVTYRRSELAVTVDEPARGTVSRVVPARSTIADVLDDAVVLVEALVRNEADELLGKSAPEGAPTAASLPPAETSAAKPLAPRRSNPPPLYVSLVYPIATNFEAPYAPVKLGIGLYGRAGELDHGLQLGLVNALSGGEGLASGRMLGAQVGLFANVATGPAEGLQLGAVNVVVGGIKGVQLGYLANVSAGSVDGLQFTLYGANVAVGRVRGAQAAAVNVAGDVVGAQVGLVNVAKKVEGLTFGLVNVADEIDGVPLGLISVTKSGGIHPVAWASSAAVANVGLKFATRHTYTMIAAHYTYDGERTYRAGTSAEVRIAGKEFVGGGFFLGGHIPLGRAFVDFDLGGSPHISTTASPSTYLAKKRDPEILVDSRARAMIGISAFTHLSFFVGGGAVVRTRIIDNGDRGKSWFLPEIVGGVQF